MLAEWSVECAADDPILIVPWSDPVGGHAFVDLRANPYDFDLISEAEPYPALMQALRALNATRSPVFTAKCDAWSLEGDELANVLGELDLDPAVMQCGFASYIDLIVRDRQIFASFHQQEQILRRITRLAAAQKEDSALLDCVLRPALVDFGSAHQGYAVSLYVKAVGSDAHSARTEWAHALESIVTLIRSKEFIR